MKRLVVLLTILATAVVLAACGDPATVETSSAAETGDLEVTTTTFGSTEAPEESSTTAPEGPIGGIDDLGIPEILQGFSFSTVWVDEAELFVAIAGNAAQRQQGLMNVTELGALDGMVFVFDQDSSGGFWMKNTFIPLDIAFFDAEGEFVDGFVMEPCTTADCPIYRPSGSYRFALEMPAGDMSPDPQGLVFAP
ncbi:MAG: DUF192 domain-containing protein [bacterium]|nr:DUF192 domain-containing protein [bacterium]